MQLDFEKILLSKVDEDSHIQNKTFVKNRIEARIAIINLEMVEEIVEDEEPMEEQSSELKDEVNAPEKTDKFRETNKTFKKSGSIIQSMRRSVLASPDKPNRESEIEKEEEIVEVKPKVVEIKDKELFNKLKARAEEYKRLLSTF